MSIKAPLAVSVTSHHSQTQGKQVLMKALHLDEIPGAMDRMGWTVSARMMRRWFARQPAWVMPRDVREGKSDPRQLSQAQYEDQLIKLEWVAGFPRTHAAFTDLVSNWASPAGIELLTTRLTDAGWKNGQLLPFDLGRGLTSGRDLAAVCQVNARSIGSKTDVLDDLYGALGKAVLHAAVVGRTTFNPLSRRTTFHPAKLGVYVRDTYDFTDTRFEKHIPLGIWSRDRCLNKAETADFALLTSPGQLSTKFPGFVPVYNDDFRRWQAHHKTGSDFVVYSDVTWTTRDLQPILIP
ncbi:DUF6402 family protein [Variovorax sp. VNK109]|uniref:DUF6402 family protein n=1 Tax=Variovorax sp. VNK109 TaxID=3400919 RepID=UPI003C11EFF3